MDEQWEQQWEVLNNYWINIQYATEKSLHLVDNAFQCDALTFDENFRENFLRATNDRIAKAYELFLNNCMLKKQFMGARARNVHTSHNVHNGKTNIDANGDTGLKGSCRCQRPGFGTAQSTYKTIHDKGHGNGSTICVTIVISNQPANEPKTRPEVNVVINRAESDKATDEAESISTAASDRSQNDSGNDTTNDLMVIEETGLANSGSISANALDTQAVDPINDGQSNDAIFDQSIGSIIDNGIEMPEIDSEVNNIESEQETTTEPTISMINQEEVNHRPDVNTATDEPQSLGSDANENGFGEENIETATAEASNGSMETSERNRAMNELNEINEISAPEVEPVNIDLLNDSIVGDLTVGTTAASPENIDNQQNRNDVSKKTPVQRRKRKNAEASTSNGNLKKKRKIVTRSTLKTIPEMFSESPLVDLTFDEAGSSQQSNSVSVRRSQGSENNSICREQQNGLTSIEKSNKKCEFCNYVASSPAHLEIHRRKHTGEKPFECNICAKRLTTKAHLKTHMRTHANQFSFQCSICQQGFSTKLEKDAHEKSCNVRRFECYMCKYVTLKKSDIVKHMRIHTGELPFKCNICVRGFTIKQALNYHIRTHAKLFPFHCSICRQGFSAKLAKETHEKSCNVRRFECYMCKYVTLKKSHLVSHMHLHNGGNTFKCLHCAKRFVKESHLKSHLKRLKSQTKLQTDKLFTAECLENDTNPNSTGQPKSKTRCEFCKYVTKRPNNLIRHRRKHIGEKPFECNICAKRFGSMVSVKSHVKVHARQLSYQCSICNKGFTVQRTKIEHEKQCSPQRFECYLCKYDTIYKWSVVKHMLTHTALFRCTHCSKRFKNESTLKMHLKRLNAQMSQNEKLFTIEECLEKI